MAITTYAELQTAVASWLHRTDLTTQIVDFISLAEVDLNNELRLLRMETDNTLTLTSGSQTVALPTGFLEPLVLEIVISGNPNDPLTNYYRRPENLNSNASSQAAGRPKYWTINSGNIEFEYPADQTYTLLFRQLTSYALSTTTTTNWLLTNYPNIYLYGTLLQSAPYIGLDARLQTWQTFYDRGMKLAKNKAGRSKSFQHATTDLIGTTRTSNIITG